MAVEEKETVKLSVQDLQGVAETLLLPLYLRAAETRRGDAMVRDDKALELVDQIEYDWSKARRMQPMDQVTALMRVREFDRYASAFLAAQPAGVVVNPGCGLDTRFHRLVGHSATVTWYDLDLPDVIALRRKLLAETPRNRFIGCLALDPAWMDSIKQAAPAYLFLTEGVLSCLHESEVKGLVLALKERFPGAELITHATSPLLVRIHNLELASMRVEARLQWGLKRNKDVEGWAEGIRLLDSWRYFDRPEPRLGRYGLMRYVPGMSGAVRIVHYRLGEKR